MIGSKRTTLSYYRAAQTLARSATPQGTTASGFTPTPFKSPPEGVA